MSVSGMAILSPHIRGDEGIATWVMFPGGETSRKYVLLPTRSGTETRGQENNVSAFVEKVRRSDAFELCGRMIRQEDELLVFIDGIGRFSIASGVVMATLLGLGNCEVSGPVSGIGRLSESGRGLYLDIGDESYVTPVVRVRAVMEGRQRKGPVSRVR